jgi:serine/threonine-protein kinase
MELVIHHVQTPPVPPSQRSGVAVPQALEELILACLEKDPARRPTTAIELGRLLEATGLPGRWTPARAREWWEAHLPAAAAAER